MANETHEKHEEQQRSTERQSEPMKRAQSEATAGSQGYGDKVKAYRQEQKLRGKSKATGAGSDADGKGGLASAKDLFGDLAHGHPMLIAENPAKEAYKQFEHPGRKDPDAQVDYSAASKAYETFDLANYGVPKTLIGALIRNEQYWTMPKDVLLQDPIIRTMKEAPYYDMSIGPAQIKLSHINHLVEKYPKQLADVQDDQTKTVTLGGMPVGEQMGRTKYEKALEPKYAALLVAAYLADKVERFEHGVPPNPDRDLSPKTLTD